MQTTRSQPQIRRPYKACTSVAQTNSGTGRRFRLLVYDPQSIMACHKVIAYRNGGQNAFRDTCDNKSNKVDQSIVPLEADDQRHEEEKQRYEHTDAGDDVDEISDLVCNQRFLAHFHSCGDACNATHQRAVPSSNDNSSSHA